MQPTSEYPLSTWRLAHQELRGSKLWTSVDVLSSSSRAVGAAIDIEEAWQAYRANRSSPMPNLVECVANYGYARLLIQSWTEFPIEVPIDQAEVWREWGLGASLHEFYELAIAGAAGGFIEMAVKDPRFTANTIQSQLRDKYARMAELVNMPIEWFTPATFTEEELDEGESDYDRLNELFELFDQLQCVLYALPKLRDFAMTEEEPEFGLPNMELYFALEEVDLNHLYGQLAQTEEKLRPILRFLAKHKYSLALDTAPEGFWWRHWRPESRSQRNRPPRKK